ncbi:glutathione S-transferase family protein [Pedomonas mirosovicensis]|uniref:glutathione S-transferase family protein n=1 Tax=Pedomonas mirosovicensis TaxID=2908641 RepID=UPI0021673DC6|nr:glutathione S-transferase [Pedomonas mirosovicensis]MCH8685398.1 glutathione S-transferase [Pedomonas mirosovicensis]
MLKIWGRANSNNVKKALWCAEEAGVSYERIDVGGAYGRLDSPEFAALNPNQQIPVLEDGDLALWESNAIVRYLAARYAPGTLYAADPAERALADRWMDWTSINFVPPFVTIFWGLVRTPEAQRDMAAITAAVERAGKLLAIADDQLARQPFLSGSQLGMGDIPLGTVIHAWFNLPIERRDLPNLARWYDRLLTRPAYAKVVAQPLS